MHNKYIKNLICVSIILVIAFTAFSAPAYADFPPLTTLGRRVGAWVLSAITATNIALTSTVAGSQGADIINFLGDPFDVTYSYTEMWDDKPTIQIWEDYVTIDGVDYTDIWLSNEAAQKFKTDGLDFATAYSIASNTNGTFAEGVGSIDGNPIFLVDGAKRSQKFVTNYGDNVSVGTLGTLNVAKTSTYRNGYETKTFATGNVQANYPTRWWYTLNNPETTASFGYQYQFNQGWTGYSSATIDSRLINTQDFDFDFVAGTIDPSPLNPDDGIMIRVPSDTPGLQQYITNNYYMTNPFEIDPTLDPDIVGKLDDLIDIIAPILVNLDNDDITFVTNHQEPTPPQDTLLPDTWWSQVVQKFDQVIQTIQQIPSQIQIPSYQTVLQNIQQTISSINDKLGDLVDDIIQAIEEGPIKLVDKVIDALKNIFASILATLASALGIWHYVVEWISSISAPFTFIFGIMQGTSYTMVLPIYAFIAGTIVIAVYRRFGQ